ncbi:hypothetical protein [Streptomyces uncialis]|uniref:hypothetical protein n=1 Tax=Streptomyces uncialis TaxID=1048205 RepID=UPI0033E4FD2C
MSFGDPNNPYGQSGYGHPPQPQQPGQPDQPGYGYPQAGQPQQAQQPGQPGYGYPQAPPVYPGAYPGGMAVPMEMPGLMKTSRVLLFINSGFQILFGLLAGIAVGAAQDLSNGVGAGEETDVLAGAGYFAAAFLLGLGALSIFLGVKFSKGGSGIRITTIVYAALMILVGLLWTVGGEGGSVTFLGIVFLVIAGIILASMVNSQASAWFNRPRY